MYLNTFNGKYVYKNKNVIISLHTYSTLHLRGVSIEIFKPYRATQFLFYSSCLSI